MSKKLRIEIIKDGPYKVSGAIPLSNEVIISKENEADKSIDWKKTKEFDTNAEDYHLCRCGQSSKEPFCDGTHLKKPYDGSEVASRVAYEEQAEVDPGESVDLLDQSNICAGLRFCRPDGGIRHLVHNSGDKDLREKAKEQTFKCAAGRITLRDKENNKIIEKEFKEEISTIQDPYRNYYGPLWIKGDIEIIGSEGKLYENRERVTLCRCGESNNKPYCDSAHYECRHMILDKNKPCK